MLDTHVWVWFVEGTSLGQLLVEAIESAAARGQLWVPAISLWEVGLLVARERLQLTLPLNLWLNQALTARVLDAHLVTRDEKLLAYAQTGALKVLPA